MEPQASADRIKMELESRTADRRIVAWTRYPWRCLIVHNILTHAKVDGVMNQKLPGAPAVLDVTSGAFESVI
jgi:hypothetical protein